MLVCTVMHQLVDAFNALIADGDDQADKSIPIKNIKNGIDPTERKILFEANSSNNNTKYGLWTSGEKVGCSWVLCCLFGNTNFDPFGS